VVCSPYGDRRGIYRFWWGNQKERDNMGDPGVDVRIIFRWIFRKCDIGMWNGSNWLKIGTKALVNVVMNLRVP